MIVLSDKPYVPAAATDIVATWRRHGYVPPSELPEYQEKWEYYQSLHLKKEAPHEAGQVGGVHLKETTHHKGKRP